MLAIEADLDAAGVDRRRPRTRAECPPPSETCPFVSCRHHLWLDVIPNSGSVRLRFPGENIEEHEGELCSLRVADDLGGGLEKLRRPREHRDSSKGDIPEVGVPRPRIARLMNLRRGSIKLLEEAAIVHLKEGIARLADGRELEAPPRPVVRSEPRRVLTRQAPVKSIAPRPDEAEAVRQLIMGFGRSGAARMLSVSSPTAAKLAAGKPVYPRTLRVVRDRMNATPRMERTA
jgi:hypothetical protein